MGGNTIAEQIEFLHLATDDDDVELDMDDGPLVQVPALRHLIDDSRRLKYEEQLNDDAARGWPNVEFRQGEEVVIQGLQTQADLNGVVAVAFVYDADAGRIGALLDSGETHAVRPERLKRAIFQ